MENPYFIDKNPRAFTLSDWAHAYRAFVSNSKDIGRWPYPSDADRRLAWKDWKAFAVYNIGL